MITPTKPYFWIRSVTEALAETGQVPLFGSPPPFPWELLCSKIQEQFGIKDFSLSLENTEPLKADHLLDGLGSSPVVIPLSLSPLANPFFFAIGSSDVKHLTTFLLDQSKDAKGFTDETFTQGFFRFISLNVLDTFQEINPFEGMTLTMSKETSLPDEPSLALNVRIALNGSNLWGRVICPPDFLHDFQSHFSTKTPLITASPLASTITVPLKIEAGSTALSLSEWQSLKVGDLLLLDYCGIDPHHKSSAVEIVLGKNPLFQGRLKEGKIKILDYSFYSEEKTLMEGNNPSEGLSPEELPEEEVVDTAQHLWSEERPTAPLEQMLAKSEVPITLVVEIGRLHMSLEKLLELEPGNTLTLTTRPEDTLHLTLQGKPVAKAELVKIGDVLGVKILKLGM